MKLRIHYAASSFLDASLALLQENEALNNLPIGIANAVRDGRRFGEDKPFFATIEEEGSVTTAAVMTPPHLMHVFSQSSDEGKAFGKLADYCVSSRIRVPGVVGTKDTAERCATIWSRRTGSGWGVERTMRVFELTSVKGIPDAAGDFRLGDHRDVKFVCEWTRAFYAEIGEKRGVEIDERQVRKLMIAGNVAIWVDAEGAAVSLVCSNRRIVTGKVITLVYTPPEHRGNGYASACLARYSQQALDDGAAFCCLFADVANPDAIRLYERIGYNAVGDYLAVVFEGP